MNHLFFILRKIAELIKTIPGKRYNPIKFHGGETQDLRAVTFWFASQFSDIPKANHEKKTPTIKSVIPKKIMELNTFIIL